MPCTKYYIIIYFKFRYFANNNISPPVDYLSPMLLPATLNELLESSDVVGNIRFSHPTLYVFPGGQGDAALFGINGFNMLGKCLFGEYILFCVNITLK